MLCLPKLCKPTNGRYLLSCLSLGSNQGLNPVPSANLTDRARCLAQLERSLNTCKQRIMGDTLFDFGNYVPSKQLNLQSGHLKTVLSFSTSTKCMQDNPINQRLEEVKAKNYIPVYFHSKLRYIRIFSTLSKMSCLSFAVGTPVVLGTMLTGVISQNDALGILITLGFYTLAFTGQSYILMSKIICKVMVSDDENYVKLSHLTVLGKRRDVYAKVSDIVPVQGALFEKKFQIILLRGSPKKLILMPEAGGEDTNFEALEILFSGAVSTTKDGEPES
ncbi:hypothetical protein BsWGS_20492 [Bradybaena similaris]